MQEERDIQVPKLYIYLEVFRYFFPIKTLKNYFSQLPVDSL